MWEEEVYLALVEHGDLDEDDGERGGAELGVVLRERVAAVAPVGAEPEQPHPGDDDGHVHPLQEEQHGHGEADGHREPQERHDHRRPHLRPRRWQRRRRVHRCRRNAALAAGGRGVGEALGGRAAEWSEPSEPGL
jgi:hypothetical protein